MINLRSIKTQLAAYLVLLALWLAFQDRGFSFLISGAVCLVAAVVTEAAFLYFKTKKWQVTESAVIAGAIVGYVASSDEAWWKLALAAAFTIVLKHAVRWRNKHIFNPAALGLFVAVLALGVSLQWKGTYLWYLTAPCGVYLAWKMRKLEILAGYAGVSLLLFGAQALLQGVSLLNIFGYFSYFYIFIMVIEPKTTPASRIGKYVFGAGLAGLIFLLNASDFSVEVELLSLLAMNAAVPLLNRSFTQQGGPA